MCTICFMLEKSFATPSELIKGIGEVGPSTEHTFTILDKAEQEMRALGKSNEEISEYVIEFANKMYFKDLRNN